MTDSPETASGPAAATEPAAGPRPTAEAVGPRARWALLLGVITIALGALGVWALADAHALRANASGQNAALTDWATTSAVNRQISTDINTIFSYRYSDTAATRRAAQSLLTGPAIRQYDQLFTVVERDAGAEKLVVTTRVTSSGVEFLAGDRARVLVFASQQDTRNGTSQSSYSGAMLAVTALRRHGDWRIENIETFGSG